jgi:predicted transcriptional regulator
MCIIWDKEPIASPELVKLCFERFGWKKSTTYSVIKRLSVRGALKNVNAVVTSLVSQLQVQKYESEQILEKTFDNSLPNFITAFLQGKTLTQDEATLIKLMIEEATR